MQSILDAINEWIKEILIGAINGNLSTMFGDVNEKVGTIAAEVGQTPQGWNAGIFSMIQSLSENVIVPIAGLVITYVLCVELISMVTEKNNMHDIDTFMFFISPNDDNYDFIMLTLNASLNEIYYEQVEKNTVFSLSGYLEKKEQPMNVEPLPDETSLSAEEQSYNFLFYALYSINYTLPDPAAITVAERDSILKAFRAEMQ